MRIDLNTNSTLFLLPALKLSAIKMRKAGFINAYIADGGREDVCKNPVYLLFNIKKTDHAREYQVLVNELDALIVDEYDYPEDYVVLVLPFPDDLADDYRLFLQGKYSNFSEKMKSIYEKKSAISNPYNKEKWGFAHSIVYKKSWVKEFQEDKIGMELPTAAELWSSPCFEDETIDEEKLLSFKIQK